MDTTPHLELPLIAPSQAQKHVTHNEALVILDALVQLTVADRTCVSAPEDPEEGQRHIVAAGASGAWSGWDGSVALYADGAWQRMTPLVGWVAWIVDESRLAAWNGSTWSGAIDYLAQMGVNTDSDTTNRLAVKSDAVLFSHDDVTPGSGDMRFKLNKAASGGTGSLLYQTGWSGRAEMGLCGSDAFSIKVSADGTSWVDAVTIDPATGAVTMPATGTIAKVLTAEDTSGVSMANATYTAQVFGTTTRNDFGESAWDGSVFTAPHDGSYDISACLSVDGTPSNTTVYFLKNGAAQLAFSEIAGVSGQNTIVTRAVVTLSAGDTLVVYMRHNAGSTQPGLAGASMAIIML